MRVLSSIVLMGLLVAPFALSGVTAGEDPYNRDCEGVVVLIVLCAGADGGGNGGCDNEDNSRPEVSCWYTYGWNLNASSDLLPGGGRLNWTYDVTYCLDGEGCTTVETGGGETECTWAVDEVAPCLERDVREGALDFVLALGQCVVVTATVSVWSEAWAPDEANPVFHAFVDDTGEGGAASCYLDNGRD